MEKYIKHLPTVFALIAMLYGMITNKQEAQQNLQLAETWQQAAEVQTEAVQARKAELCLKF